MTMEAVMPANRNHLEPPTTTNPEATSPSQETKVESLLFRRFADFCQEQGVDVNARLTPTAQPTIARLGRDYIVNTLIPEVQQSEASLLPATLIDSQFDEYYLLHNPATQSPARQAQQKEFRRVHIGVALGRRDNYSEIAYADNLVKGAIYSKNGIVARSMADLLSVYGMTLKKIDRQLGGTALHN